jgi:hypothetical protein
MSEGSKESPDMPLSNEQKSIYINPTSAAIFKKSCMLKLTRAVWLFLNITADIESIQILFYLFNNSISGLSFEPPTRFDMLKTCCAKYKIHKS